MSNESRFLTLKEASTLTGKSEITIRRMIKYLLRQRDMSPDRKTTQKYKIDKQLIDQWIVQEKHNETPHSPFIYKISEEMIRHVFSLPHQVVEQITPMDEDDNDENKQKTHQVIEPMTNQGGADREMVIFLKEQVKFKDTQISEQNKQITSLIERARETNILLGRTQDNNLKIADKNESQDK